MLSIGAKLLVVRRSVLIAVILSTAVVGVLIIAFIGEDQKPRTETASGGEPVTPRSQFSPLRGSLSSDFNGDGYSDLAVGVPLEDVSFSSSGEDAGAIQVIYGSVLALSPSAAKPDKLWAEASAGIKDSPEPGDQLGSSLAAGDFNNDGYSDLAVSAPYEDVVSYGDDAGAVHVIYGSTDGLKATPAADGTGRENQFWHQNSPNIKDEAEQGDSFGHALAAGDFNRDGYDDLVIGTPRENVGNVTSTGAINIIYGSSDGLSAVASLRDQLITQNGPDNESNDLFGWSLAVGDFDNDDFDDLAVGVIGEDVDTSTPDSGAVHILRGSSDGLVGSVASRMVLFQGSSGIDDAPEPGDNFGWSLAAGDFNKDGYEDLAVGVIFEDVISRSDEAGAVNVLYGSSSGIQTSSPEDKFLNQNSLSVADDSETDDNFGAALAAGDFNNDGYDDLVIGVPGETIDAIQAAGSTNLLYGSRNGLQASFPDDQVWNQESIDVRDDAEPGDRLGCSLLAGDFNGDGFDDLAIGVPLEDVSVSNSNIADAGIVNVLFGSPGGLRASALGSTPEDQWWHQNAVGVNDSAESKDSFGILGSARCLD